MDTGLVKSKSYDWKSSNLSMFGSDTDKSVKKEAAETEEAWKPLRSINNNGLFVWRIHNFKLERVHNNDLGTFYGGDSYIILNCEKVGSELLYDAHFWIGKESTQDEYGTAAYKTVELDTFLDDAAIQYREVQGFESTKFKSYFKNFKVLQGGYASGFKHANVNEYQPRLLHFCNTSTPRVELYEVPLSQKSLGDSDVFILDLGSSAIQWNGTNSSKEERYHAAQFLQYLEGERNGRCKTLVLDAGDKEENKEFLNHLPDVDIPEKELTNPRKKAIYKYTDVSGTPEFSLVCENQLPRSEIKDDDVYFIDSGNSLYVHIGDKCSINEKRNAFSIAHEYLKNTSNPFSPIVVISSNRTSHELESILK